MLHSYCRSAGALHHVIFIPQLGLKENALSGTCCLKEKRKLCSKEAHTSVHISLPEASYLVQQGGLQEMVVHVAWPNVTSMCWKL